MHSMFDFLQISANDDCPGNKEPYQSHETKTSTHIDNKKTYGLSSLRINLLKLKSQFPAVHFFRIGSVSLAAGVHVWRKSRKEIKTLLIKMSQTQRRTSSNSPRHYYGKMDNLLSTTILPWVAVLRDKLCSTSEDMEELSAHCTAPSKSRISALSSSYLLQMKLLPWF